MGTRVERIPTEMGRGQALALIWTPIQDGKTILGLDFRGD
ncbi:MAG: hypothetical protein RIS76_812 [Verrucomicrobiota bacterium]|jgi:hypothetical protein